MTPLVRDGGSPGAIAEAAARLKAGGLVVIPTETVYGLAADISSPAAVDRVFTVKGRPRTHPLIVHITADSDLECWSREAPEFADDLIERFWPGPLTIVVKKSVEVPDSVTGGQPTVALRAPRHPVTEALLATHGGGLAAPSANTFGAVSPTTAAHALADIGSRLDPERDMILDGGPCTVGLESTIVDCTGSSPSILRTGQIGVAELSGAELAPRQDSGKATEIRAPGSLAAHYAPRARVVIADTGMISDWTGPSAGNRARVGEDPGGRVGLIASATVETPTGWHRLAEPPTVADYAHGLYTALRAADAADLETVVAVPPTPGRAPHDNALTVAITDRLQRAAASTRQD